MSKTHDAKHEAKEEKASHHTPHQQEKDQAYKVNHPPAADQPIPFQPVEAAPAPEVPAQDDQQVKLAEEAALLKDKLLRLAAEFDNYKKRKAKEFESVIKIANEGLVLEIIAILDNFERALAAAQTSDDFSSFHQGVELIYKQLGEILQKQGVQVIQTAGKEFNPHMHEAIQQVDQADQPSHIVVQEVQKGYVLNDRVLRAAKVIVNK